MSEQSNEQQKRYTGRVKWFNNKSGFGFITHCDDELQTEKDIFVHWSSIQVENSQYKYLVQGEYVDFSLVKPEKGNHDYHAVRVSGVKGGNLMCETRRENYTTQRSPRNEGDVRNHSSAPRRTRDTRPPRDDRPAQRPTHTSSRNDDGYTRVVKRNNRDRRPRDGNQSA
jgi:CspA family cold shock protein